MKDHGEPNMKPTNTWNRIIQILRNVSLVLLSIGVALATITKDYSLAILAVLLMIFFILDTIKDTIKGDKP
jgi:hypothetical protein